MRKRAERKGVERAINRRAETGGVKRVHGTRKSGKGRKARIPSRLRRKFGSEALYLGGAEGEASAVSQRDSGVM